MNKLFVSFPTEQKPKKKNNWPCPHCEKMFRTQAGYREHVIVKHEKRTPHKCDQCTQSFGTLMKLKNHRKLVHTRVICNECGKEICNAFTLKRHKANVHGIKPKNVFQCQHCPLFYEKQLYLDNHVNKQHLKN